MGSIKDKDDIIFGDKSLSDIFEDIYINSKDRKKDIDDTLKSFMKFIKQNKDVSFIGPVIKDLLHVSVQNDEQLVKMATVIQRIMTNNDSDENEYGLTDDMKQQLLDIAKKSSEDLTKSIPDDFGEIEEVMLGDKNPELNEIEVVDSTEDGEEQTDK